MVVLMRPGIMMDREAQYRCLRFNIQKACSSQINDT